MRVQIGGDMAQGGGLADAGGAGKQADAGIVEEPVEALFQAGPLAVVEQFPRLFSQGWLSQPEVLSIHYFFSLLRLSGAACCCNASSTVLADSHEVLLVALEGRQPIQSAVNSDVINPLEPCPQPGIEIIETADLRQIELGQELIANGAMPLFELSLMPPCFHK